MKNLLLCAMLLPLLAACGERDIAPAADESGARRYQGKVDAKPWESEGPWKGDRVAWETQIKSRQMTQHEYKRIGE